ncbi:MarR family winged helix-turn-helix transcriptional regulator [Aliiruegeria lutimaris]|uniref:DNA-binding transcriptional regulator, MarR family n=1 Tax=Aliiruegeria lutimaris TaxID=571298 RepID=A0A1G8Y5K4_9RHOB|nr:MarR family winged helix-turn-helix transcriptional regulator [Aliiruegeria lutimaris]SDJ97435.1 DNA-binding transcriptional regulator, MarR family [Aliiruegeria lutimaris]
MRDQFNLSEFLPYRLAVLSERVSKRVALAYSESHGLTVPEWRVLVHLSRCRQVSVREIHNCVNLEKPRVSRAVARLEAVGLVDKTESQRDHRLVDISLTEAGWKLLDAIVPEALAVEQQLLSGLSEGDRERLLELMERLHSVLDADPRAATRSRMDLGDSDGPA